MHHTIHQDWSCNNSKDKGSTPTYRTKSKADDNHQKQSNTYTVILTPSPNLRDMANQQEHHEEGNHVLKSIKSQYHEFRAKTQSQHHTYQKASHIGNPRPWAHFEEEEDLGMGV